MDGKMKSPFRLEAEGWQWNGLLFSFGVGRVGFILSMLSEFWQPFHFPALDALFLSFARVLPHMDLAFFLWHLDPLNMIYFLRTEYLIT
jgi:hypothetical protein